ncbi:MAG TPA: LytTR family DNA-binding domain-containing protein, partial [Polyangiaceae bacterium]|nr:LytTR family DNA-binding domain-containing protein [Polyangiaceae bacterium]
ARLPPERFVRVHRSELVNLAHVERVTGATHGDGILVLRDGSAVVLSRTCRAAFLERFRGRAAIHEV